MTNAAVDCVTHKDGKGCPTCRPKVNRGSAKRVGAKFETDVLGYLRDTGGSAERLAKRGSLDEGDIVLVDDSGAVFVAELKARRDRNSSLNLGSWLEEARREAEHYREARNLPSTPVPVLIVKRPRGAIGDAFVVMRLEDFIDG